jgi:hypothetical protein
MFESKENRYIIERKNPSMFRHEMYAYCYIYEGKVCVNLSSIGWGRMFDKHDLKQMLKIIEIEEARRIKV